MFIITYNTCQNNIYINRDKNVHVTKKLNKKKKHLVWVIIGNTVDLQCWRNCTELLVVSRSFRHWPMCALNYRNIHRQTLNALHTGGVVGGAWSGRGQGRNWVVHIILKNPAFDLILFLQRSWHLPQSLHPVEQTVDKVLWSERELG